jgi:deazaflavin-dependent oxidoreductase (nitroreductase family)
VSWLAALFVRLHRAVYRLTGGRIGGGLGDNPILLLHSVGRRSGKRYVSPLTYYRDGQDYVIIGSNWGRDNHPGWYYNLLDRPETTIQVGRKTHRVEAVVLNGAERERLWAEIAARHPQYPRYQGQTSRPIPLVALQPTARD